MLVFVGPVRTPQALVSFGSDACFCFGDQDNMRFGSINLVCYIFLFLFKPVRAPQELVFWGTAFF